MLRPLPLLARARASHGRWPPAQRLHWSRSPRADLSADEEVRRCLGSSRRRPGRGGDWLRKSGVATAHKKGRGANEGAVVVASDQAGCVLVELNSETDCRAQRPLPRAGGALAKESLSLVRGGGRADLSRPDLPAEIAGRAGRAAAAAGGRRRRLLPVAEAISVAVSQLGENLVPDVQPCPCLPRAVSSRLRAQHLRRPGARGRRTPRRRPTCRRSARTRTRTPTVALP